jgi:hypothetical protein
VRAAVRSYSKQPAPAEVRLELPKGFTAIRERAAHVRRRGGGGHGTLPRHAAAALAAGTLEVHAVATRDGAARRATA